MLRDPRLAFIKQHFYNGERYMILSADPISIIGKSGNKGFSVAKTGELIVVGFYDEKLSSQLATLQVNMLAQRLIKKGL